MALIGLISSKRNKESKKQVLCMLWFSVPNNCREYFIQHAATLYHFCYIIMRQRGRLNYKGMIQLFIH